MKKTTLWLIITMLCAIPDIKKDANLTWQRNLFLIVGLYFIVSP